MTSQSPETPVADAPANDQIDLSLAALAIFDGGGNTIPLASGKVVTVFPARMNQLAPLMRFIQSVAERLDTSQLATLIDLVAGEQKKLIAAGKDPSKFNAKEIASSELVGKAFGNASLISLLLAATFDTLPDFVALFTDISPEEFGALEIDEGALIPFAIFSLNYDFFTQRLLPILMGFIKSLASENQKQIKAAAKSRQSSTT